MTALTLLTAPLAACGGTDQMFIEDGRAFTEDGLEVVENDLDDPPSDAPWAVDHVPAPRDHAYDRSLQPSRPSEDQTERAFPRSTGEIERGFTLMHGQVEAITYERINGKLVFEGDIILSDEDVFETPEHAATHFEVTLNRNKDEGDGDDEKSAGRSDTSYRWPNKTVYYRVASNLVDKQRAYEAMQYWRENAGLRFVYRTTQSDYIRFVNGSGCSSYVGRQGGQQEITLGEGCRVGQAMHEIGHAIGFWHEQARTDRDDHVEICWDNIEWFKGHNFETYRARGEDGVNIGAYDISSLMHYGSFAFSDGDGPTIIRRDGTTFQAQRDRLTVGDRAGVRFMYGLGNDARWHGWFSPHNEVPRTGDFNRDGLTDVVTFVQGSSNQRVWVALSNGLGFDASSVWSGSFCDPGEICEVGDFDGDGRDDIISFARNSQRGLAAGNVKVALSDGTGFGPWSTWHGTFCYGDEVCKVGDFNGDGKDDIAAFVRSSQSSASAGYVWVALSTGTGFTARRVWHRSFCFGSEVCEVGDIDGDGKDDLYSFMRSSKSGASKGDVLVARSFGWFFASANKVHGFFCVSGETCRVDDVNGDGRDDLIAFVRQTGRNSTWGNVWVSYSTGTSYGGSRLMHRDFCLTGSCQTGDVTGDGLTDFVHFTQGSTADINVAR